MATAGEPSQTASSSMSEKPATPVIRRTHASHQAGHWVQQEAPAEFNRRLLDLPARID